jgi:quercetin dioxygenase-like cupin family protein
MPQPPFANSRDDAPAYWSLGTLMAMRATAEQTGGAFSLMEEVMPKGAEPPPHVHHAEDEAFYLLEGALTVRVGDEKFTAEPGAFVFCPREIPHLLTVETDVVRILTLCTPGGLDRMFVELGEPAPTRTPPPPPSGPPDIERVVRVAGSYGAEILPHWP